MAKLTVATKAWESEIHEDQAPRNFTFKGNQLSGLSLGIHIM